MNRYEWKLHQRRARLEANAARLQAEGQAAIKRADELASVIPFGQPILLGHHSERRDRRYRERIHNTLTRGFALQDVARRVSHRADAVGSGGISSDDPDAIAKLQAELQRLRVIHERMKQANVIVRKFRGDISSGSLALQEIGFTPERARALFEPDFCGRIGFPSYAIANNNGNMRRIEGRIAELQAAARREAKAIQMDGFEIVHNTDENRVQIVFPSKPDETIRKLLKSYGFRWAPSAGAWQRQLNSAGISAAELVTAQIHSAKGGRHD